jgi:hypothetical protein
MIVRRKAQRPENPTIESTGFDLEAPMDQQVFHKSACSVTGGNARD